MQEKDHTWLSRPTLFTALNLLRQGVIDREHAAIKVSAIHIVHGGRSILSLSTEMRTIGLKPLSESQQSSARVFFVHQHLHGFFHKQNQTRK